MGIDHIESVNIGVIGSTLLTYKLLLSLEEIKRPLYVFGIPDDLYARKANAFRIDEFCSSKGIILDKSNSWDYLRRSCRQLGIDMLIEFGDSRIIPQDVLQRCYVIGNHGAELPYVQGGASLVWGRLLNTGVWGVSLFRPTADIDGGDILGTKMFNYDKNMTMREFVDMADDATVDLFRDWACGNLPVRPGEKWQVRVSKVCDTFSAISVLQKCREIDLNVYMPPRNPVESRIKREWPRDFQEVFKYANDKPYPRWFE